MTKAAGQKLLEEARAGDRAALEELLTLEQARIYRFGMKMCGDPEDAADVLQETMLAVARSIGEFRGGSSLSTWLYKIARSFCIKKHRRSKFAPEREASLETDDHGARLQISANTKTPDDEAASRELQRELQGAIDDLDPIYREVLVLRDVEGLRAAEVAEVTGISVQAVKSRLHRARVAVRDKMAPLFGLQQATTSACVDLGRVFSEYLEGDVSPETCSQMEKHLAECTQCQGACEALKRAVALCRGTPAPQLSPGIQESVRTAVRAFLEDGANSAARSR